MSVQVQPYKKFKMPFNYVQVVIAGFGAVVTSIFVFFVSEAAGASMQFSGGLFEQLTVQEIVGYTMLPFLILGFITIVVGRFKPGFCKVAQWIGVVVAAISAVSAIMFATDIASAIGFVIINLVIGASWYLAVNYSNKKYNEMA